VQSAFPGQALIASDIQATFSGIRAVVDTGKSDPSRESREHVLWNEVGLLTITGGKLTTFRLMALEALKAVRKRLATKTNLISLPISPSRQRILEPVQLELFSEMDLSAKQRLRLAGRYGQLASLLIQSARPGDLEPIADSLAAWVELRWAARCEAVAHLDDLLLRRVRLGLLLPQGGQALLEQIRSIVQPELGWDDPTWETEQRRYLQIWQGSYSGKA